MMMVTLSLGLSAAPTLTRRRGRRWLRPELRRRWTGVGAAPAGVVGRGAAHAARRAAGRGGGWRAAGAAPATERTSEAHEPGARRRTAALLGVSGQDARRGQRSEVRADRLASGRALPQLLEHQVFHGRPGRTIAPRRRRPLGLRSGGRSRGRRGRPPPAPSPTCSVTPSTSACPPAMHDSDRRRSCRRAGGPAPRSGRPTLASAAAPPVCGCARPWPARTIRPQHHAHGERRGARAGRAAILRISADAPASSSRPTISEMRTPNSSSITTTSPRAIEGAVHEQVDGAAGDAVELDDRAGREGEQVADRHAGAAQLGGHAHLDVGQQIEGAGIGHRCQAARRRAVEVGQAELDGAGGQPVDLVVGDVDGDSEGADVHSTGEDRDGHDGAAQRTEGQLGVDGLRRLEVQRRAEVGSRAATASASAGARAAWMSWAASGRSRWPRPVPG